MEVYCISDIIIETSSGSEATAALGKTKEVVTTINNTVHPHITKRASITFFLPAVVHGA